MKVRNLTPGAIYLKDLKIDQVSIGSLRGEDRYIGPGATIYLEDTDVVLRSASKGDIFALAQAGILEVVEEPLKVNENGELDVPTLNVGADAVIHGNLTVDGTINGSSGSVDLTGLPRDAVISQIPDQYTSFNDPSTVLTIHASDNAPADDIPSSQRAGKVVVRGGHGASAISGDNYGMSGGAVEIYGGDGGTPSGFAVNGAGGPITIKSGNALGVGNNGAGSITLVTGHQGSQMVNGEEAKVTIAPANANASRSGSIALISGVKVTDYNTGAIVGGCVYNQFYGANDFGYRAGNSYLSAGLAAGPGADGYGGNNIVRGGTAVSVDPNVPAGGDVIIAAGRAIAIANDLSSGATDGTKSGDVILTLSSEFSTNSQELWGNCGGLTISGADGIAYWQLHSAGTYSSTDHATPTTNLQGSQRLHVLTLAQETAMAPSFEAAVPDTGFLHYVDENPIFQDPSIASGGYQTGFRGRRSGVYGGLPSEIGGSGTPGSVTRSMARVFSGGFNDGDLTGGEITVTHNLFTFGPQVMLWLPKFDLSNNVVGLRAGVLGTDYNLEIPLGDNNATIDPFNTIKVVLLAPIDPTNSGYSALITIVGF